MKIITGGAGFIGSNFLRQLNIENCKDIIVVDNIEDGRKLLNLVGCDFIDLMSPKELLKGIDQKLIKPTEIFHFGACSSTLEWNGNVIFEKNIKYTLDLIHALSSIDCKIYYASSAAVYGRHPSNFNENNDALQPVNAYAFSKLYIDRYFLQRKIFDSKNIYGLRFFNVYGPNEFHKDNMCSPILHFYKNYLKTGAINVFTTKEKNFEINNKRDFISITQCIQIISALRQFAPTPGIYNIGTGHPISFYEIAKVLAKKVNCKIDLIPMPDNISRGYQAFTSAGMTKLNFLENTFSEDDNISQINQYIEYLINEKNRIY